MRVLQVFLLSLVATSAFAQPRTEHSRAEGEIVKVRDALLDAYLHHNYAVLSRVLGEDFTYIDDDGFTLNKAQILDLFKSGDDKITSYKTQDDNLRMFGDCAILTYRYRAGETYKGHEVGGDWQATRIFVKRNGQWVVVAAQDTRISAQPAYTALSSGEELTIKRLEQDWLDAYREGDAEKVSRILAEDFVGRWADGSTTDKTGTVEPVRTGAEKHSANRLVDCKVRIYGDTAVVTGINTEESILEGRDGSGTISFTDVFVRRGGQWQVVASETKKLPSPR